MKNEVTVIHTAYEDGPKAVATVDVGPSLSGMGIEGLNEGYIYSPLHDSP